MRAVKRSSPHRLALLFAAAMTLSVNACAPRVAEHGYVFDERDLKALQPGVTTQAQVENLMGTPSTSSIIQGEAWFYIRSTIETVTFYPPEEVSRRVVAIHFDEQQVVNDVAYYALEDGKVINFVSRKTPTRGKELTFLQQLFGNIGKFNNPGAGGGGALPSSIPGGGAGR